jgi:thiol-disulfide isomerase/thioredoxin
MLSISIGPLAFPLAPLLLLAAAWLAGALARRSGGDGHGAQAEGAVWAALALGLLAARASHVLEHADAYLASPWAMLDLRDGGWHAAAGFGIGGLWLAWRAWAQPELRRAIGQAAAAGTVVWGLGSGALFLAGGGASRPVAPDLALIDPRSGHTLDLPAALAGQSAVVNLWATWCAPCRAEMPVLAAAQQRERDIRFLFVNQGESAAVVLGYLQREGIELQGVWLDPASALGPAVGSKGLPTTLFFDAAGRRVHAHFGLLNAAALQARLKDLRQP